MKENFGPLSLRSFRIGSEKRPDDLIQEVEAGEGVLAPIDTPHSEPGAVIGRHVLIRLHLDRVGGRGTAENGVHVVDAPMTVNHATE